MSGRKFDPWDILGWKSPPDWRAAKTFTRIVANGIVLLVAGFAGLLLLQFANALLHFSESPSIRDIGLALAALVGFPFLVWRSVVAAKQAEIAQENLTTQLINKAVEGLGAEKTVKERGQERTQPNLEVRIGAIYQLDRIARNQAHAGTPQGAADHIRIMKILCAYIRENAPASKAVIIDMPDWPDYPENAGVEDLKARSEMLAGRKADLKSRIATIRAKHKPRTDIQTALEVLGTRDDTQIAIERAAKGPGKEDGYRLDLRATNLQAAAMAHLDFDRADLGKARMEGAVLWGARLERAVLWGARLERAVLWKARMEGAHLREARLEGANLAEARLERAVLWKARMEGADLLEARLEGANLGEARLEVAVLWKARMEGADLWRARMEGANLAEARMEGANLAEARMEGAVLWRATLRSAHWAGVTICATPAQCADLRGGKGLGQSRLLSLVGNAATLLPETPEGKPDLYIPHKWATEPPGFDRLLAMLAHFGQSEEDVRAKYLCAPGEAPRKTGTPWPADADPPWGAQEPDEADWAYLQRVDAWAENPPWGLQAEDESDQAYYLRSRKWAADNCPADAPRPD